MSRTTLILRYTCFAVLATILNLGVQRIVLAAGEGAVVFALAVFAGTLAGLVLKYALDKRYIFADLSTGMAAHTRKFGLYTAMGLITTAIFWGTETGFWLAFGTDRMRELGAVIGLAIGYVVKYQLDRRYVFTDRALSASGSAHPTG
ncbi:GtrA-like protein [Rhodobacteraceae bacterium THAF1]|uniref:GtrA family protein n=1 Tax=Palleronia sp. THAF1 TaxID=2587842 RepID=UPI000F3BE242|nr:GtrA family protein [Palleronia sp. THAF1]QFU07519.1 GtrA-like protein [Palleronia sp. THAF1]VDC20482.1 GtrA-like protein [Rhodobacteraceae bacterium THAF1]